MVAPSSEDGRLLSCHRLLMIEKMSRADELIRQLRAILLPSPPTNATSQLTRDLFEDILRSFAVVLHELRSSSHFYEHPYSSERDECIADQRKRRKVESWTNLTTAPYIDGYQWKKYGQKKVNNSKFLRSYYRCAHKKDLGCPATKTVQQMADDIDQDPPKFCITYSMHHTCEIIRTPASPYHMGSSSSFSSSLILESSNRTARDQRGGMINPPLYSYCDGNMIHGERESPREFEIEELLLSEPVTPARTPSVEDVTSTDVFSDQLSLWDFSIAELF